MFRNFVNRHKPELVEAVESGSLFTAQDVSSLLDTALPGISEMGALLAIKDALQSGKYETIVVDTAPFGHTLRLFGLPQQFGRLVNFLQLSVERDQVLAQHFGGSLRKQKKSFIGEWRGELEELQRSFAMAEIFLVTTAERFALNESLRCIRALQSGDPPLRLSGIVLNRITQRPGRCGLCQRKAKSARDAQLRLRKEYTKAAFYVGVDPGSPIQGVTDLKRFADAVFGRRVAYGHATKAPAIKSAPKLIETDWPLLRAPLNFVLGKGGVGKTTVSASLGYRTRQQSDDDVEICSVDPAPSLDDVFQSEIDDQPRAVLGDQGFRASEVDSVALYRSWVAEIRDEIESATSIEKSGVHIDLSYERKLFSELLEIVPPGLDEVLAILRILDLTQGSARKVVIDMAPTGHALELLRTPQRILVWSRLLLKSLASHRKLALAREAAVKIAELEVRARELSHALTSREVAVYTVMLPEPLPDRETERLLRELKKLSITPKAIFVNRVTFREHATGCVQCRNASRWQMRVLEGLKRKLKVKTLYVVPALMEEPAGRRGLRNLTRKIWQLS